MDRELSVVTKAYDLALWLLPQLAKFPREHRFTLGDRLEAGSLDVLEALVEASYTRDKRDLLRRANIRLERLRYLARLAKDLRLISLKQYEFAIRSMQSIGVEIGGWAKRLDAVQ